MKFIKQIAQVKQNINNIISVPFFMLYLLII